MSEPEGPIYTYHLFAGSKAYTKGGMEDYQGSFISLGMARYNVDAIDNWWHIARSQNDHLALVIVDSSDDKERTDVPAA